MDTVNWEPQPYFPSFEDMAHPFVKDVERTFATAEKSPMARKDCSAAYFRDLKDQYCFLFAAVRKKYMHTIGLEKQYLSYRWKNHFRKACGGRYTMDKKYWDIDQRGLPMEKRCDMNFQERQSWDWLVKQSQNLDETTRKHLKIDEIDKRRKELDEMGIPNYVLRWYKGDWQTIGGLVLMMFPALGRTGPFTIEKSDGETSDGILAEVNSWLEFVKHWDGRFQRDLLFELKYFIVPNAPTTYKVRAPRRGFFNVGDAHQAPPNIEAMDMAASVAGPSITSKRPIEPVQSKAILSSQSNVETAASYTGEMQLSQSIEEEDDQNYDTDEDPDAAELMELTRLVIKQFEFEEQLNGNGGAQFSGEQLADREQEL